MKLFGKKEPRVVKEDDPLIVKLWYNKRYHALISLSLYFVFFLVLIIIINVSSANKPINKEIKGTSISDMFTDLNKNDVSYNYVINKGSKTYYFSGNDKNDGIYGTILYNGESTSINIVNKECAVGTYEDEEFKPMYTLCPENIDYSYFDIDNIYELIKNVKGTNKDTENYYLFNLDNNKIVKVFYDDDKELAKIIISEDKNTTYELSYNIPVDEEENSIEE